MISFRSRAHEEEMRCEVNMTPFMDVLLVLLVIFMVALPAMTTGVSVDLPEGKAQSLSEKSEPLTLVIDANGSIFLRDKEIGREDLVSMLSSVPDARNERIYIRADRTLSYAKVVDVMSALSAAGFGKIALVTIGGEAVTPENLPKSDERKHVKTPARGALRR